MGKKTITITLSDDIKIPDEIAVDGIERGKTAIATALRGIYGLSKLIAHQAKAEGLPQAISALSVTKIAFTLIEKEMTEIITSDKATGVLEHIGIEDIEELKRQIAEMRGGE